jgi:bacterioferritin-associated ferredoxin
MYACICLAITEDQVKNVGGAGTVAPSSLIEVLGLKDRNCCGRCAKQVDRFVTLAWEGAAEADVRQMGTARHQTQPSFA